MKKSPGRPKKSKHKKNKNKTYSFRYYIAAFLETKDHPASYLSEFVINDSEFQEYMKNNYPSESY